MQNLYCYPYSKLLYGNYAACPVNWFCKFISFCGQCVYTSKYKVQLHNWASTFSHCLHGLMFERLQESTWQSRCFLDPADFIYLYSYNHKNYSYIINCTRFKLLEMTQFFELHLGSNSSNWSSDPPVTLF